MNVQNTSSIYSNIDLPKKWNTEESNEIYKELKNDEVSATSITFDDYSNLSTQDIDKLFPEELNAQENYKAHALHTKANGTTDDILNKILFERELSPTDDKYEKYANQGIGMRLLISGLPDIVVSREHLSINKEFRDGPDFHHIHSTKSPTSGGVWTPEELFESFRLSKRAYEENYANEKKEMWEASHKIHAEIEREYYKRVAENNAILSQYTRDTKSNVLEESIV